MYSWGVTLPNAGHVLLFRGGRPTVFLQDHFSKYSTNEEFLGYMEDLEDLSTLIHDEVRSPSPILQKTGNQSRFSTPNCEILGLVEPVRFVFVG